MRRIGLVLAVFALTACGSSVSPADPAPSDGGTDGASSITPDQACGDLAASYCAKLFACTAVFGDIEYGDVSTCTARGKASCLTSLRTTGVAESPSQTEDCSAQVPTSSCDDLLAKKTPDQCIPAVGAVSTGGACGDPEQCASGFCAFATDSTCGTCAVMPKVGDACTNLQCGRNLDCVLGQCQKPGVVGDACDARNNPCAPGNSCFASKCVKGGGPGAACDTNETTAPNCDVSLGVFCNSTTKVCQKAIEAKAGETCGLSGTDYKICTGGSVCKLAVGTFGGTCIAPAADGAACSAGSVGPGCLAPASCIAGICKLYDGNNCK